MRGPRFETPLSDEAAALNASVDFDSRLLPYDVEGSKAHAKMLGARGVLDERDVEKICIGLDQIREEWERGDLVLDPKLEDVHINVEVRLVALVGEAGKRLHTARSRNDQVATDLRLYVREACDQILGRVRLLRVALVKQARDHMDTLIPGYTHMQRAQPTRLSHHLLAYDSMLARDAERISDARKRANRSPLGAGALTGTSFPIDREQTAAMLGFSGLAENTLDAVSDRDFAVELVAACALCMTHLSRLGEELVLWATQEFGFVRLPEGYCSGSSIMPQKVNPDIPELVRGKSGRVVGDLMTLLMVIKGLPLAYNKDLQETQEPLYDAVETTASCLGVMAGCVDGARFLAEPMRRAVDSGHLIATELADYLTRRGMPFREAHAAVGALVRTAIERGVELSAFKLGELQSVAPSVEQDVYEYLDAALAVERRDLPGGPARARVLSAIERAERDLAQ